VPSIHRRNWLASNREQFVAPRRLIDHKFQVLGKKVAFVNQALGKYSRGQSITATRRTSKTQCWPSAAVFLLHAPDLDLLNIQNGFT
jgi:hypothetical protein